ncbi:MAG: hypothetical protein IJL05_02395 [Alphaproteobacteria bacterium]|nr:hypothetical protein [Alphaproteobacteria bacterium]
MQIPCIAAGCAENATDIDGVCKCNIGYYGDGAGSCTKCPSGKTTYQAGGTTEADCKVIIKFNCNGNACEGVGNYWGWDSVNVIPGDIEIQLN